MLLGGDMQGPGHARDVEPAIALGVVVELADRANQAIPGVRDEREVKLAVQGAPLPQILVGHGVHPAKTGAHAHNNLGLGIGNTLAAVYAGADQVDGSLRGLGAGAGNAATELIAAVLDRAGFEHHWNVFSLLGAAEFVVAPFLPFQPIPDRDSIAIGYAGVYSTFLLHAKRLGKQYDVDPLDILVELGRRKAMAGQEDWILDVALELARQPVKG